MDPNKKVIGTVVLHSTVTKFHLHKMHYLKEGVNMILILMKKNVFSFYTEIVQF